jgi:hypothetical protein
MIVAGTTVFCFHNALASTFLAQDIEDILYKTARDKE